MNNLFLSDEMIVGRQADIIAYLKGILEDMDDGDRESVTALMRTLRAYYSDSIIKCTLTPMEEWIAESI